MDLAITRGVSASIGQCELTHMDRTPIDHARAHTQHEAYVQVLRDLGVEIITLPTLDAHPDAVFVEDTAVVVDELGVICRAGAESRRGETASMEACLSELRPLVHIEAPGTLEGGDVIQMGRSIFVGRSTRTNDAGIAQLRAALEPLGYTVHVAEAPCALHLKTACTAIGDSAVLANPAWVDTSVFGEVTVVESHPDEPFAANVVKVHDTLVVNSMFPKTVARLRADGFACVEVDASELAKAEGSLTCKSVLLNQAHSEIAAP